MLISDFAIKRPMITIVAMVALVGFGLIALLKLQTDEFPDVAPPFVTVGLIYPGASPDGVERELLDPIEEAISSIAGRSPLVDGIRQASCHSDTSLSASAETRLTCRGMSAVLLLDLSPLLLDVGDAADVEERLLGDVVEVALDDRVEGLDCLLDRDRGALDAGELLRHVGVL